MKDNYQMVFFELSGFVLLICQLRQLRNELIGIHAEVAAIKVQIDDLLHDLDLVTQGMSHVYMSLCDFKAQYLHIRNQMYPGDLNIASAYYADSVDCCHVEALLSMQYQVVETLVEPPYYERDLLNP